MITPSESISLASLTLLVRTFMSDIFEIPESLSPRLRWLRDHQLTIQKLENGKYECSLDESTFGIGDTAEEACVQFCILTQLPHWNTL